MVFISHRRADSVIASQIRKYLDDRGVEAYLDVHDPNLPRALDITKHIISNLDKCSHLIAVYTPNTRGSMWVPFELLIRAIYTSHNKDILL